MGDYLAETGIKSVTWSGIVTRCGCTDEQKQSADYHAFKNEVCPNPKEIKDLGVLSYTSSSWFKNLWWKIFKKVF